MRDSLALDAVVFGGGAAGLWLLDELSRAGYSSLLLEAYELGGGQTVVSQGIIHGGLKYTLSGLFTLSAHAISNMPLIWRKCLASESEPDLSNTRLRAEHCHLWRTSSIRSRLAMIGARAGLRVAPVGLAINERPAVLADCPGAVARLDEQVIEPASFIGDLSRQQRQHILKIDLENGLEFIVSQIDQVDQIRLINPQTGGPLELRPKVVVLTAGTGNAGLRKAVGLSGPAMQRRPLHMVMLRGPNLPVLNGHCVDGSATRLTITTTKDSAGRMIWQIGGRLAEDGVSMEPQELVTHAKAELQAVLPGLDLQEVEWSSYRADRAEAAMRGGSRPDDAFVCREGNVITGWPTKLALVPEMVRRVIGLLGGAKPQAANGPQEVAMLNDWPRPMVALPPWETNQQWFTDV